MVAEVGRIFYPGDHPSMRALNQRRARAAAVAVAGAPRRHKPDYWIIILTAALLAIGVVVVYSISPALAAQQDADASGYVQRQLIAIVLGFALFMIAARIPLRAWQKLYVPLLVVAASATVLTLILPINVDYPAHRWIRVGGFSFQSVELLKFALLLWLASFLARRMQQGLVGDVRQTLRPIIIVLGVVGVVVAGLQSDLGSAAVIAAMTGVVLFVAGVPLKPLLAVGVVIAVGAVLFIASSPYRQDRVATFWNPEADCTSTGYQACQALIAVGSGGMFGLGLGNSVQAYGYLPEAENDSIFAIYAEKFGFVGVAILLGLLLALFTRIKQVADRAPDDFTRLMVMGILVWLSTQAIINIGAMLGLLPLKGITLPLISYGGSSVLMVLLVLGVVFHVSYYTHSAAARKSVKGNSYDNRPHGRRLRGAYHASARSRL